MTPARHTKSFSYCYFNYFRHVAMLQKFAGPLVGAPFCGAAVRPNMLNIPKSASDAEATAQQLLVWPTVEQQKAKTSSVEKQI